MSQIPLIPYEALNGGLDWVILTGKHPGFPYANKQKLSDTPDKFRYDTVMPGNCFTSLSVSIPGSTDALSTISDKEIAEACATLRPLLVRFTNCLVKIYTVDKEQRMSATASGVELVKSNK